MSEKDTGGSAFPHAVPVGAWGDPSQGMTLRDYFAAAALQGASASNTIYTSPQVAALDAYRMADAMLAERAK